MAKTSAAKRSKPAKSAASTNRIGLMDDLRGFCVFCMIFYHGFLLAFQSFGIVAGGQAYDFFRPVQPIFAGIFILLCGISCRLSHSNWERGLKLFGVALAINLITILGLPQLERFGFDFSGTEIWFGILNLLSVSILFFALAHKVLDWLPPAAGAYLMLVFWYVTRFFHRVPRRMGGPPPGRLDVSLLDVPAGHPRPGLLVRRLLPAHPLAVPVPRRRVLRHLHPERPRAELCVQGAPRPDQLARPACAAHVHRPRPGVVGGAGAAAPHPLDLSLKRNTPRKRRPLYDEKRTRCRVC